jgi:hypothetical protein
MSAAGISFRSSLEVTDLVEDDIRDAFYALEKKLMKKATVQAESEPVEILLERTNSADFKDTVSMENNKICCEENLIVLMVH